MGITSLSSRAEESDLEIQAVLRAEIRDLQFRHEVEIALLHATYALILNGPADGLPALAEQTRLTLDSVLFDTDWYLKTYPDVAQSGMVPAEHYVRAGAFEGRDPGPKFATMAYYFANPDVAEAGWPALVHYVHSGKTEGRLLA